MSDTRRIAVNVTDDIVDDILQYQQSQGCITISEALRSLVKRGLEAWAGKPVQSDAPQTNSG